MVVSLRSNIINLTRNNRNNPYAIALCYFGVLVLFARLCGGHFNPGVSISLAISKEIPFTDVTNT
jgi:glycerol uptake facilitator-like aquaporin